VIHEVVVRHEPPPGYYEQQVPSAPPAERRRSWPALVAFYISIAATVVVTIWFLAFAGRAPSPQTTPPWQRGSEFNVGPHLDGRQDRPQRSSPGGSR